MAESIAADNNNMNLNADSSTVVADESQEQQQQKQQSLEQQDATTATTNNNKKTPSDFLKSILGRPIRIKLNSGIEYRGVLGSLDGYLNIAIEQTQEYNSMGQLQATYGDCFIRGNNVMYISTPPHR